jgi:hypothetical protein
MADARIGHQGAAGFNQASVDLVKAERASRDAWLAMSEQDRSGFVDATRRALLRLIERPQDWLPGSFQVHPDAMQYVVSFVIPVEELHSRTLSVEDMHRGLLAMAERLERR